MLVPLAYALRGSVWEALGGGCWPHDLKVELALCIRDAGGALRVAY